MFISKNDEIPFSASICGNESMAMYVVHTIHVWIHRGEQGVHTPLENYKNIGFLSNTRLDPLKITTLPIQHSMLGHHWPARETPFKWRFPGGLLMAR